MSEAVQSLNEIERRVLGVLIEKSLAQPDYYPMTLNAVVAACNQKQNRDPVLELDEDLVLETLEQLRAAGIVGKVLPAPGARKDRFKHEVESHFGWQKRERAVMAELLLRGPQTQGELRSRCSRLVPFEDLAAVSMVLDCLAQYDPPLAAQLPRVPGQSATRYAHLLYPEDERPAEPAAAVAAPAPDASVQAAVPETPSVEVESLRTEVENLQVEVAELHEELAEMRRKLEAIEARIA